MYITQTLCLAALCSTVSSAEPSSGGDLNVTIPAGRVHGIVDPTYPNTRQFLGIPYAKPPLRELRWKAAQPLPGFGDHYADKLPPSCMQILPSEVESNESASALVSILPASTVTQFGIEAPMSEDCLTLSIWTPRGKGPADKLPVFAWVYGGAFTTGGQNVPYQIPTQWVERTKGHVVVSFNYRLNLFGFPDSPVLKEKNLGLRDQRFVMEWIKENIAAFGGDPNRIVLWGQSAGAISIGHYAYAYPEDPIASGFIMDSGSEYLLAPVVPDSFKPSAFSTVAQKVGCQGLQPGPELDCMRKVPGNTLHKYFLTTQNSTDVSSAFLPILDNVTVFPNDRSKLPIARVPAILGNNRNEVDIPILDLLLPVSPVTQYLACGQWKTIQNRIKAGVTSLRYQYWGNFPNISPDGNKAYHSSEIPMIMGTHGNFRGPSTALENATSELMQDRWLSFATKGASGLESNGWPHYDNTLHNTMEFAHDVPGTIQKEDDPTLVCALLGLGP